jgi:hypothetical protein
MFFALYTNPAGLTQKYMGCTFTSEVDMWGFSCGILRSEVLDPAKGFLGDGNTLQVYCQISVEEEVKTFEIDHSTNEELQLEGLESHSAHMKSLLNDETFSDVKLTTTSKSFPAIKSILACESSLPHIRLIYLYMKFTLIK